MGERGRGRERGGEGMREREKEGGREREGEGWRGRERTRARGIGREREGIERESKGGCKREKEGDRESKISMIPFISLSALDLNIINVLALISIFLCRTKQERVMHVEQ